jgi:hypothetical protein
MYSWKVGNYLLFLKTKLNIFSAVNQERNWVLLANQLKNKAISCKAIFKAFLFNLNNLNF